MKVSYVEGLATRIGSESCVTVRKDGGEALTGVRAGQVLSRERYAPWRKLRVLRGADAVEEGGRPYLRRRLGKTLRDPARSQTPSMHASTLHGNREILHPSAGTHAERIGKSKDKRR